MIKLKEFRQMILVLGIGGSLFYFSLPTPLFTQSTENPDGGNTALNCLSQIVSQKQACQDMENLRNCVERVLSSSEGAGIPANIRTQAEQLLTTCEQCIVARASQDATHSVSFEGGTENDPLAPFRDAAAGPSREAIERRFPQLDRWIEEFEKIYPSLRNRPGIRPEYFDDMRDYHRRLQEIRNAIRQNPQNPEKACKLIDRHNQLEMERMQRQLQDTERELNEFSREVERRRDEVPRAKQRYDQFGGILILPGSDTERAYNEAYAAYSRAFWSYDEILGVQNGLTARKREQEQRLQQARERLRSCEVYLRP